MSVLHDGAEPGSDPSSVEVPENRLLTALAGAPSGDGFEPVDVVAKEPIYGSGQAIEHVYFPLDAVVSIVTDLSDGSMIEVATVGREGMVGVNLLLHARESDDRAFVQVPGRLVRAPASRLLTLVDQNTAFGRLLYSYVRALVAQITRSVACNRAHPTDQRTARWLLMTHDRVGRDTFPLTQEFLGHMLGVARPRVSTAASALQRAGLIRYSRGRISVTDRRGLEGASCECYRVVADEYERLLA